MDRNTEIGYHTEITARTGTGSETSYDVESKPITQGDYNLTFDQLKERILGEGRSVNFQRKLGFTLNLGSDLSLVYLVVAMGVSPDLFLPEIISSNGLTTAATLFATRFIGQYYVAKTETRIKKSNSEIREFKKEFPNEEFNLIPPSLNPGHYLPRFSFHLPRIHRS